MLAFAASPALIGNPIRRISHHGIHRPKRRHHVHAVAEEQTMRAYTLLHHTH
jgi:hypothetical protein